MKARYPTPTHDLFLGETHRVPARFWIPGHLNDSILGELIYTPRSGLRLELFSRRGFQLNGTVADHIVGKNDFAGITLVDVRRSHFDSEQHRLVYRVSRARFSSGAEPPSGFSNLRMSRFRATGVKSWAFRDHAPGHGPLPDFAKLFQIPSIGNFQITVQRSSNYSNYSASESSDVSMVLETKKSEPFDRHLELASKITRLLSIFMWRPSTIVSFDGSERSVGLPSGYLLSANLVDADFDDEWVGPAPLPLSRMKQRLGAILSTWLGETWSSGVDLIQTRFSTQSELEFRFLARVIALESIVDSTVRTAKSDFLSQGKKVLLSSIGRVKGQRARKRLQQVIETAKPTLAGRIQGAISRLSAGEQSRVTRSHNGDAKAFAGFVARGRNNLAHGSSRRPTDPRLLFQTLGDVDVLIALLAFRKLGFRPVTRAAFLADSQTSLPFGFR